MSIKQMLGQFLRARTGSRFTKVLDFEQQKFVEEVSSLLANEADQRELSAADRHALLYRVQRALLPEFVIADHGRVLLEDQNFRETFVRFSDENWTSFERKWNLNELLKLTRGVAGDFAECGVFRGGSAYFMCVEAKRSDRHVHLFDSFAGLSTPNADEDGHWSTGDLAISEQVVVENLAEHDNFTTYQGWIPERFPAVEEKIFSFVHIDVDLEQPTADSIEFFFPRLSVGGILLLDDHGSAMCPGARRAALHYFADRPEEVLDLATGQGLVIKRS